MSVLVGTANPVARLLAEAARPFAAIDELDSGSLRERIAGARVVLIGEASHGTAEFYAARARLTRDLITHHGFTIVAAEADWPDARRIDAYVRHEPRAAEGTAFTRFPSWMWRNTEVAAFAEWLRAVNAERRDPTTRVGFYGLDIYSLFTSARAVIAYLDDVDPPAAAVARERYGCLAPWTHEPAEYGLAAVTGRYRSCAGPVVEMLEDLLRRRLDYLERDGARFLDAAQNARLVASAERYYRIMYHGSVESWNLRDAHMFETLESLLRYHGPDARAVVWAHNSHVGNAAATELGARGEWNVGQLARGRWGSAAYLVGFGTDSGTVTAASRWDGPTECKRVRPALPGSYERLCHEAGVPAFLLHLREPEHPALRPELAAPRLERAIGVLYLPETERASHYFMASLPEQFDAYLWFDESTALTPLPAAPPIGVPDTYPFGV